MKTIFLKANKAAPFWKKESLVFSGAIATISGDPKVAELVAVCDANKNLIGFGVFNPYSQYRVRLLAFSQENLPADIDTILRYRFITAKKQRQVWQLPNDHTNAYRLINSEGDYVSGLTVDVFAEQAVVMATAYWVEQYRELIIHLLQTQCDFSTVHWRSQVKALRQDGWMVAVAKEISDKHEWVRIKENDIYYQTDLAAGQKTGFYCDQRDNRVLIRHYVNSKKVLDCYCYTGGFALNAAMAGAKEVLAVDSSAAAIALANANAKLNNLTNITFLQAKVEHYLKATEMFDVIILDPPKLSPGQQHVQRAKPYYLKLNQLALTKINPGGFLLTCSCSNAITSHLFLKILQKAAARVGRKIEVVKQARAAQDHPFSLKAKYGDYLTALLLLVH